MNKFRPKRVAFLREARGYSQAGMARMLDVSRTTVWHWEVGKYPPTTDHLQAIADLLDTYPGFFFAEGDDGKQ